MQKELNEIVKKLNQLSEKYKCRIDIDCYEIATLKGDKKQYIYRAKVDDNFTEWLIKRENSIKE